MSTASQQLEDGAIVIAADRIEWVGPYRDLPSVLQGEALSQATRMDFPHHVLMPGLVNAHGHAAMSLLRGIADDMRLETWLREAIWPTEARCVNESFVTDGTRLAIAEMLLSGTTCFADMYFFPEAAAAVAQRAGMRAQIAIPIIDFPTSWSSGADESITRGVELIDAFRHESTISLAFGPHSTYVVKEPVLKRIATLAAELNAPVQIHLHETATEIDDTLKTSGCRPFEILRRNDLLTPSLQAVHMTQVLQSEAEQIAAQNAAVIHCPQSNLRLGSGHCPVAMLQKSGVNLGLGTDGAASNNGLDLFKEMNTAALLAKGINRDPEVLAAPAALHMATLGSARALGLDDHIGSLAAGKQADIIAIDMYAPAHWPLHNPVSQLVYTQVSSRVSHVWVAGRLLVQDRHLLTLDLKEVLQRASHWRSVIAGTTS